MFLLGVDDVEKAASGDIAPALQSQLQLYPQVQPPFNAFNAR